MPIKKAFNKRSTRNNIARKRKKFKPRQMNVTSETAEVQSPPNRTPEDRSPPNRTPESTQNQENTHHVRTISPTTIIETPTLISNTIYTN